MNLLLLDQFSDPGGAQQCLLDLLPALRREGWNALVGLPGDGELFGRVRDLGFPTARISCGPYRSGRKSVADVARFLADTPRLACQIRRLATEFDAAAIYLNGPRLLPAAASCRPGVPVVFHSHSALSGRRMAGASLRRLQAHVIGACRYVADPWRAFVPPERISVIYNGVAGPSAPLWRPHPDAPRVGCIGRIAPEKGQLAFIEAAQAIHGAIPDSRFVIQGAALFGDRAAQQYQERVQAAAAGLPVDFAGWTNDIYRTLAHLDLLLVPSQQEATTRVILEACAAGVPVIAFPTGGIPEVLDKDCLAESPEQMARRAVEFLRHPDAALSQRLRETWCGRFTLERYQSEVIAVLERSVRSIPPPRPRDAEKN